MKFASLSWQDAEKYLQKDDMCILPIGCTEQHAFLSLCTDSILAEKISLDAAGPLNIPVLPVLNYGHTPLFMDYPGTITLKIETLCSITQDILDSLVHHGFHRILIVNGHGGNMPLSAYIDKWKLNNHGVKIKFHNWWNAPKTIAKVFEIDPVASHASWMENFEWTRLKKAEQPELQKEMIDIELLRKSTPEEVRRLLGDGNFGGYYSRSDDEMNQIWETAIMETRELLMNDWS